MWYRFRGHAHGLRSLEWDGPVKIDSGRQDFRRVIAPHRDLPWKY
jgi:hypothetical protein